MTDSPQARPLVVRRTIKATADRLFAAWTDPAQLVKWWGPGPVKCSGADVDLRVGGAYRIGNKFPDGNVLWIAGEFESIERPRKLVYSWRIEAAPPQPAERVTVEFVPNGIATDVVITHERIASAGAREQHRMGWEGCLDGLVALLNGLR
jgi:uncharacterized protein YndB with AHSA1/START domain